MFLSLIFKSFARNHVIPLAIVFLLVLGQVLDRTREERRHLVEDLLLRRSGRRMSEVHHQGEVTTFPFVKPECCDKFREHLRSERLAAADQVQVETGRGIPSLLCKRPVREIPLHGLTVLVVVLEVLSIIVVGIYVHQ